MLVSNEYNEYNIYIQQVHVIDSFLRITHIYITMNV